MGLFRKIGKGLKKAGKAIGKGWEKIDDIALPAIGFALGGPAGAALGSAAARGIGDGKFNAKATLLAGAKGYAGGQLAGAAGLQGGQGFSALGSSAKAAITNPGATASRLTGIGGGGAGGASASMAPGGAAGGVGGAAAAPAQSGLLSRAKGAFDKIGGIDTVMGGMSAYEGYRADRNAEKYRKLADQQAQQQWQAGAPLREAGMRDLMNEEAPDLSGLYAGSQNAFRRMPRRPGGM